MRFSHALHHSMIRENTSCRGDTLGEDVIFDVRQTTRLEEVTQFEVKTDALGPSVHACHCVQCQYRDIRSVPSNKENLNFPLRQQIEIRQIDCNINLKKRVTHRDKVQRSFGRLLAQ
jgi:hypothetical protein